MGGVVRKGIYSLFQVSSSSRFLIKLADSYGSFMSTANSLASCYPDCEVRTYLLPIPDPSPTPNVPPLYLSQCVGLWI